MLSVKGLIYYSDRPHRRQVLFDATLGACVGCMMARVSVAGPDILYVVRPSPSAVCIDAVSLPLRSTYHTLLKFRDGYQGRTLVWDSIWGKKP